MQTNEYKCEFRRAKYDQIAIAIPKGQRELWNERAKAEGLSLSKFIQKAVQSYIENQTEEE